MAIFSLNHSAVGRSTHRAGTAGAHIRYIGRASANPDVIAEHMPTDWRAARQWMNEREQSLRKNARVIDKIMVALPIELTPDQRRELVRSYVHDLTNGQVPWYAAIHQSGEDEHNPHAHIAIHDKSVLSGRRVVLMSERGSTSRIRKQWAVRASNELKFHGHDITIDHRSYQDRGIQKQPGRHEGWREHKKKRTVQACLDVMSVPNSVANDTAPDCIHFALG